MTLFRYRRLLAAALITALLMLAGCDAPPPDGASPTAPQDTQQPTD